jgi:inosine-uridine nucleoside N-ribohydrolase
LDCDPGHDDALAIILASYNPKVSLLGISTVSGNQSIDKTTLNAAKVLAVSGVQDVCVYKGQGSPLLRVPKHDPEIHGECGLGGSVLSTWTEADVNALNPSILPAEGTVGKKGVIAMAEAILASPTPVALVATGALTNVALCLQLYPEIKANISQISFMGGAMETGNRSPVAEFNILCDPEAAEIVVNSGCEVQNSIHFVLHILRYTPYTPHHTTHTIYTHPYIAFHTLGSYVPIIHPLDPIYRW